MTQFIHFQYGFEKEKEYILENLCKLLHVTGKEFFYSLEDYSWFAPGVESVEFGEKLLGILEAYKAFEHLRPNVCHWEIHVRRFMPRCYSSAGNYDKASAELLAIANIFSEMVAEGIKYKDIEEAKNDAYSEINKAIDLIDENLRDIVKENTNYYEAMRTIESIH